MTIESCHNRQIDLKRFDDEAQLTLYESVERTHKIRDLVFDEEVPEEEVPSPPPESLHKDTRPLREQFKDRDRKPMKVSHPMWRDNLPSKDGFRYWDLLVVVILSVLALTLTFLNIFVNQNFNYLISFITLVFLFIYGLLVVVNPSQESLGVNIRLVASILLAMFIFAVSFLLYSLKPVTFTPTTMFYALTVVNLVVVLVAAFRRRSSFPNEEAEDKDIEAIKTPDPISVGAVEPSPEYEEEPVIIPDHVRTPEDEILDELPYEDKDVEEIIPEITVLKHMVLQDEETPQENVQKEYEQTRDENVEDIIPELAQLRQILGEESSKGEPSGENEDLVVIIPDHEEEFIEEIDKESIIMEEPREEITPPEIGSLSHDKEGTTPIEPKPERESTYLTPTTDVKSVDDIMRETPSPRKKDLVLPWVERRKEMDKKKPLIDDDLPPSVDRVRKTPHPITPKKLKTRPTDLIIVLVLTLLTATFVLIPLFDRTTTRIVLGVLLVLFLPGYSLVAALFPRKGDLDGIERGALSFGLSIAVTILLGLILNYNPWGIRLDSIFIVLIGFTLAMCLVAYLRRRHLQNNEKFVVEFDQIFTRFKRSFQKASRKEKALTIILILSIILAMGTTASVII